MLYLILMTHQSVAEPVESEERAKELFYNGQMLYEEGRYEAAILAWQKGYEITDLPAFLKNIALAQESVGLYLPAIETLKTYRAFAPFEEQDELRTWLEDLERKSTANPSATIQEPVVESNPIQETPVQNDTPELPDATFQWKPVWTLSITAGVVTAASLTTLQSQRLYTEVENICDLNNSGLCLSQVSDSDAINKFNRFRGTSLGLWGLATIGTGISVWQLSSSTTQVYFSPFGASFKGHF